VTNIDCFYELIGIVIVIRGLVGLRAMVVRFGPHQARLVMMAPSHQGSWIWKG
jgi:hypothetical protein